MVWIKNKGELIKELDEQHLALRSSGNAFDEGHTWEAKRLAGLAYTLLYNGKRNTKSLLSQIGIFENLMFVSSGIPGKTKDGIDYISLTGISIGPEGGRYIVSLGYQHPGVEFRRLPFFDWWNENILQDSLGGFVSRKSLTLILGNKDGGRHVDEQLEESQPEQASYVSLSRRDGGGAFFSIDGTQHVPVRPGPERSAMRQVAWEIDQTLTGISRLPAAPPGPHTSPLKVLPDIPNI